MDRLTQDQNIPPQLGRNRSLSRSCEKRQRFIVRVEGFGVTRGAHEVRYGTKRVVAELEVPRDFARDCVGRVRWERFECARNAAVPNATCRSIQAVVDGRAHQMMCEDVIEAKAAPGRTNQMASQQFVERLEQRALVPARDVACDVDIERRPDDGDDVEQRPRGRRQARDASGDDGLEGRRQRRGLR